MKLKILEINNNYFFINLVIHKKILLIKVKTNKFLYFFQKILYNYIIIICNININLTRIIFHFFFHNFFSDFP
jgi:hypothetical protein